MPPDEIQVPGDAVSECAMWQVGMARRSALLGERRKQNTHSVNYRRRPTASFRGHPHDKVGQRHLETGVGHGRGVGVGVGSGSKVVFMALC